MTDKIGILINAFGVDHKTGEERIGKLVADGDAIVDESTETVLDLAIKKILSNAPKAMTTEDLDYQLQQDGNNIRIRELIASLFRLYTTKVINRATKWKYWKAYWSISSKRERKRFVSSC